MTKYFSCLALTGWRLKIIVKMTAEREGERKRNMRDGCKKIGSEKERESSEREGTMSSSGNEEIE